mgnify:CR=1 FL=1
MRLLHTHAQVGRLWTSLADYYIRRGMFEKARDVYEEGLCSVITVHDFSLIYDAYTQFEESLLSASMEQLAGDDEDEEGGKEKEGDDGTDFLLKDDGNDVDLRCVCVCVCSCTWVGRACTAGVTAGIQAHISFGIRHRGSGCDTHS